MNAGTIKAIEAESEVRNHNRQHPLKWQEYEFVVTIRMSSVIAGMGMNLAENTKIVLPGLAGSVAYSISARHYSLIGMVRVGHDSLKQDGYITDFAARPKRHAFMPAIANTDDRKADERVTGRGDDRLSN